EFVADGWAPRIRWTYSKRVRPAIHMPRRLSRITLRVEAVRVERLQEITETDALAEGCAPSKCEHPDCNDHTYPSRSSFAVLWDSINAARGYSWAANPWVWVVQFARL